MPGERLVGPPGRPERLEQPPVRLLVERERLRPALHQRDALPPLPACPRVGDQPVYRRRQPASEPLALGLEPGAERLAAGVLRAGEEVAMPMSNGLLEMAGGNVALESCGVELDGASIDANVLRRHLDGIGQSAAKLEQCLAEQLASPRALTLAPDQRRELLATHGPRGTAGQKGEEDQRLTSTGEEFARVWSLDGLKPQAPERGEAEARPGRSRTLRVERRVDARIHGRLRGPAQGMASRTGRVRLRSEGSKRMDQFSYYMIRIRHSPAQSQSESLLAGVVERLGVGEKRIFADDAELLRLLRAWSEWPTNMGSSVERDKT